MTAVLVTLSGAAGAAARFGIGTAIQRRVDGDVPMATAVVNLTGALALGLSIGFGVSGDVLVVVAGFCAGLTTYSTWMVETVALFEEGPGMRGRALVNAAGLLAIGLGAAWLGLVVGRAL